MQTLGKHSQRLKDLRRRVRRRQAGEVIIDGVKLVDDVVRWGFVMRELYLSVAFSDRSDWIDAAEQAFVVDNDVLARVAPTRSPQGVVAVVGEPFRPQWSPAGVSLYLDGIQDPGNLGAIVRSAAGLGAEAVLLGPKCADPFSPAAVRGSAATVFRVPVIDHADLRSVSAAVRAAGGEVWATGAEGRPMYGWRPPMPLLLLLGAEGCGLSGEAREIADGTVTIPLKNRVESLNVTVAGSLLLAHLLETSS